MIINFKELGAIKNASIDLSKKLIVFCGPNGTGKTYLAYSIYGILKDSIHVSSNADFVKELIDKRSINYLIDFDELNEYRIGLISNFKDDLDSLFGLGEDMAKQFFNETKIEFEELNNDFEKKIYESQFEVLSNIRKVSLLIKKIRNSNELKIELLDKTINSEDIDNLSFFFKSSIFSILSKYPVSSTFILPVERNSIFTFSKELSINKQEAVDYFHAMTSKNKVNRFDLLFKKTTRYPLAIKDGLMIADDLAEIKKNKSEYYEFASEIENELLHGKIQINNDGEIQFKPDKAPKKLLPIHMTASIIKSLSSLVVYLKHLAKTNDLIIIDEPEINLHPDNQITLTRLFAKMINKGFRILISTHSDYIVREINNLLMVSKDDENIKNVSKRLGYVEGEYINLEDIEVNFFDYPKKRSVDKKVEVQRIIINSSGFEVPTINETIEKQNYNSEELYFALKN